MLALLGEELPTKSNHRAVEEQNTYLSCQRNNSLIPCLDWTKQIVNLNFLQTFYLYLQQNPNL